MQEIMSTDGNVMPSLCVKDMFPYQRPREKFVSVGAEHMAMEELIAILLRTGYKGTSALSLAKQVIQFFPDGVYGLNHMTVKELESIKGIGTDKAIALCAAVELGRRLGQLKVKQDYEDFSNPEAVAKYVMERLRHKTEEHVWVALLNAKNKLIKVEEISSGGLTSSYAEQRSVFRRAIACNAAAIILIHNHPSGDSKASPEDIRMTKLFCEAGQVMGIPVLDHVIIGDQEFTSLCSEGLL